MIDDEKPHNDKWGTKWGTLLEKVRWEIKNQDKKFVATS